MGHNRRMSANPAKRIAELREQLRAHDYHYYIEARPVISDEAYDRLFAELKALERAHPELITPDSPTQRVGGEPISGFEHVRHAVPMLSIDNTYNEKELREFDKRVAKALGDEPYEYLVDPKIDGVAVSLTYEKGRLVTAATRGNGAIGDDVTNNVRTIRSIPLKLRGSDAADLLDVRGEIYWPIKEFNAYNKKRIAAGDEPFANPRNATAGTLKQLDPAKVAGRGLRFIAHGVGRCEPLSADTASVLYDKFASWGIPVSTHRKIYASVDALINDLPQWKTQRATLPYQIDGLVLKINAFAQRETLGATSRFPRWCIAYKFEAERATSRLLEVQWQVGKTGAVTPVAQIEPVLISGTTVSNVNLHNPVQIERHDLHEHDVVVIEKAGEIIPQIVGVEQRDRCATRIQPPRTCPSCGAALSFDEPDPGKRAYRCENKSCDKAFITYQAKTPKELCNRCGTPVVMVNALPTLRCTNVACPAQLKQRLVHFASRDAMDIDSLGESTIDVLLDNQLISGVADLFDYEQWRPKLLELKGFKEKSVDALIGGIEAAKRRPLSRLLVALSIPHVGVRNAELLARRFPNMSALMDARPAEIAAALTRKSVTSDDETIDEQQKMPRAIHEFLHPADTEGTEDTEDRKHMRRLIERLKDHGVNMTEAESVATHKGPFVGKTVVVTGSIEGLTRREVQDVIKRLGGTPSSSVSKRTDLVVFGESPGSKLDKARELGVETMNAAAFRSLIKGEEG